MSARRFTLVIVLPLLVAASLVVAAPALAAPAPGDVLWTAFGATTLNGDYFNGVARARDGGVVAVGATNDSVALTGDGLICKYMSGGSLQWSQTFDSGDGRDDGFYKVAADRFGNVFAAGWHDSAATGIDYLVVKYDSLGAVMWSKVIDGGSSLSDGLGGLAVDADGNAWVTGQVITGPSTSVLRTLKLRASDGAVVGTSTWPGPAGATGVAGRGVTIARDGTVFVVGECSGPTFAGRSILVRYRHGGGLLWGRAYLPKGAAATWGVDVQMGHSGGPFVLAGPGRNDHPQDLAVDSDGNVFASGNSASKTLAGSQACLVKWSATGVRRWVSKYPHATGRYTEYRVVLPDNNGGAYVGGYIRRSSGDNNNLIRHLSKSGRTAWSRIALHTWGDDRIRGIAFCGKTGICSVGSFLTGPGDDDAIIQMRRK